MPGWYDIVSLAKSRSSEECKGIDSSMKDLLAIVEANTVDAKAAGAETDASATTGAAKSIPRSKVVLAGFSQGGALSLFTALQASEPFAGCLVMSGYLPALKHVEAKFSASGRATPVHFCHGEDDPLVTPAMGADAIEHTKRMRDGHDDAAAVSHKTYPDLEHSANMEELNDALAVIKTWLD
jgi:predicted esterase